MTERKSAIDMLIRCTERQQRPEGDVRVIWPECKRCQGPVFTGYGTCATCCLKDQHINKYADHDFEMTAREQARYSTQIIEPHQASDHPLDVV